MTTLLDFIFFFAGATAPPRDNVAPPLVLEPIGTSSKDGKLGLASLGWDFVGRDFIQLLVTDQRVMHDNFLDKILF